MECPDENALVAMIEGALDPAERELFDAHIDTCARCAALVVELARVLTPDEPSQPPTPRIIQGASARGGDDYTLGELLGRGGMGMVYAARHEALSRRVAIKLLRADMSDPDMRAVYTARLLREARLLASLSHPNIITIFDVGLWRDDQVFLAMELVEGDTLRGWLKAQPRTWRQILDVFMQAAAGLSAAHSRGVIHRDVKPENMLMGADGRLRVTDFGLARARGEAAEAPGRAATTQESALTHTGDIMGTPAYMAPEQHLGAAVDAAADQFALCVAIWEALCGQRPFVGEDRQALSMEVCAGRIRPAPHGVEAPRALFEVLRRGLAPAPRDRWPSLDALIAALDEARAPTRLERLRANHLLPVVVGLLVALMLIAAYFYNQIEREAQVELDPPGVSVVLPRDPVAPPQASPLPEASQAVRRALVAARLAQEVAPGMIGPAPSAPQAPMAARVERAPRRQTAPNPAPGRDVEAEAKAEAKLVQVRRDELRYAQAADAFKRGERAAAARDHGACLRELELAATLVPTYRLAAGSLIARCVMMSGDCARGRALYRAFLHSLREEARPSSIDEAVEAVAKQDCAAP